MNVSFVTKIVLLLSKGKITQFDMSSKEQSLFLESLGVPKDDWDRSYKQYQCQCLFRPQWQLFFLNFFSLIVFPFAICYLLFKKKASSNDCEFVEAVGVFSEVPEVIPQALKDKYRIKDDCTFDDFSLNPKDLVYVLHILPRFFLHPFFLLKSVLNIAKYSFLIEKYQPKYIIVHAEFAFSSSLLTHYCHSRGIRHIDVMHGEKLYYIRDSFFHYDECYVWNTYYTDLFVSMKAEPSQFIVAVPDSLVINVDHYYNSSLYADYKYYLVKCTNEELESIVRSMEFVNRIGKTVKFRPHPRWTNISLLKKLVPDENIEYPEKVSIMESIANLSNAVGSYTTVLNQAVNSGKSVVLDDVTYKNQYDKLNDLKYILANSNYPKLSELQNASPKI